MRILRRIALEDIKKIAAKLREEKRGIRAGEIWDKAEKRKNKRRKKMSENKQAGVFPLEHLNLGLLDVEEIAEKFAEDVGFKYGNSVKDLIDKVGGDVIFTYHDVDDIHHYRNFEDFYIEPPDNRTKYKFYISIASEEKMTKDINYFLAHLLSHYALRPNEQKKIYVQYDEGWSPFKISYRADLEAEMFAQGLLMPREIFKETWGEQDEKLLLHERLEAMAEIFNVPSYYVRARIKSLGLKE